MPNHHWRRSNPVLLLVMLYSLFFCLTPAMAAEYVVSKILDISNNILTSGSSTWEPEEFCFNDQGDIAWSGWDGSDWEIYLYQKGVMTQVSHNSVSDWQVQMNAQGHLTWQSGTGLSNIYLYKGELIDYLISSQGMLPQINDRNQVVYQGGGGISAADYQIYLYDEGANTKISSTEKSYGNAGPQLNKNGQVVWVGTEKIPSGTEYLYKDKEVFLYHNGALSNLSQNDLNEYQAFILDNGNVYLYNVENKSLYLSTGGGAPSLLLSPISKFDINQKGQIAWAGTWNGQYGIYLYTNGAIKKISSTYTGELQLNDAGDAVWVYNNNIYCFNDNAVIQLTNDGLSNWHPRINNQGEIIWETFWQSADGKIKTANLYKATPNPYARYDFVYHFNNGSGDYYQGSVYAARDFTFDYEGVSYTYHLGKIAVTTDENDQPGYYEITKITDIGDDDSKRGQVFVDLYYDHESQKSFRPVGSPNTPLATNFLGNELGYILKDGYTHYLFGQGYYEADLQYSLYEFTHYYNQGSGDSYTGKVIAPTYYNQTDIASPAVLYVYQTGAVIPTRDENGQTGYYKITKATSRGADSSDDGLVTLQSYYDVESAKEWFVVGSPFTAAGTKYLGSESGYILKKGYSPYRFGGATATSNGGYYEADLRYSRDGFTHYYDGGSGDRYTGYVYAPTYYNHIDFYLQVIYQVGLKITTKDENQKSGYYTLTGVTDLGTDKSHDGQVFVTSYYDVESGKTITPVDALTTPLGTDYLGSEEGYLYKTGVPEYHFGGSYYLWHGGYYEADLKYAKYSFKHYYNNNKGDYYKGSVYAPAYYNQPDPNNAANYFVYDLNLKIPTLDENNQPGYFLINQVEDLGPDKSQDGKVYVTDYLDREGYHFFHPFNPSGDPLGTNYLGSESGYILKDTVPEYRFGCQGSTFAFYEADLKYSKYDFIHYYDNGTGDYYKGYVYAPTYYNYKVETYSQTLIYVYEVGIKIPTLSEHYQSGYYKITKATDLKTDGSKDGRVYVTGYYDSESKKTFKPMGSTKPLGYNYLESESGYILKQDFPAYRFGSNTVLKEGGGYYEADLKYAKYDFTFAFDQGLGDYYQGYVYAPTYFHQDTETFNYDLNLVIPAVDESGRPGTYTITAVTDRGDDKSLDGQVFVTSYYDIETGKTYKPVGSGAALGTDYLDSEIGYIIQSGVADYRFGQGYYEADGPVSADYRRYDFTFFYANGSGDSYKGYLYAPLGYDAYAVGFKKYTRDENNQQGYYLITKNTSAPTAGGQLGQVFVTSYTDQETKVNSTPVNAATPLGLAYLKSELGYIKIANIPDYKFGQGCYEADLGDHYTFRYTYMNGDYYDGIVYRAPGVGYYPGRKITVKNETGRTGYYQLISMTYTGDTAKYNQVYVNTYHDGESNKNFTPLHKGQAVGTTLLGSELDYIGVDNVPDYKFGQGFYEADVGDQYTFRYVYGNGDWYSGLVYRTPGVGYYPGRIIDKKNELGLTGYYELLSMTYTGDTAKYNQVYVNTYHDGETNQNFTPINAAGPLGTALLASEAGYIIKTQTSTSPYYFGKGYYEADEY